jgi:hypothetical protein
LLLFALLVATAAFSDPISLDPGSPTPQILTPLSQTAKDNPLHLTAAQQMHMNARKLRFQRDATSIFSNPGLSGDQKGSTVRLLETQASKEILAMLDPHQYAIIQGESKAEAVKSNDELAAIKRQQALSETYEKAKARLMKSLTADQEKHLLFIEKSTQATRNQIMKDATLSNDQKRDKLERLYASYDRQRQAVFTAQQNAIILDMEAIAAKANESQATVHK